MPAQLSLSRYMISSSPRTMPQFLSGIVHFFAISCVARYSTFRSAVSLGNTLLCLFRRRYPLLRLLSYPKDHRHISRGHPLRRDFSAHSGLQANILHFRFLRYVWIKLPCDLSNLLQGLHMLQVFYLSVFSYRKMYSINKYNEINLAQRTYLPVLYLRKKAVCDIGYHTPRSALR